MSDLADDKWVRVMCDYSADGVWAKDGAAVSADDLPVSVSLRNRLRAWQDHYEASEGYMPPHKRPQFDCGAFAEEGRQIARSVKAELPDWTVIYFDEEKSIGQPPNGDRSIFEYEIVCL